MPRPAVAIRCPREIAGVSGGALSVPPRASAKFSLSCEVLDMGRNMNLGDEMVAAAKSTDSVDLSRATITGSIDLPGERAEFQGKQLLVDIVRVTCDSSWPIFSTTDKTDPTRAIVGQQLDVTIVYSDGRVIAATEFCLTLADCNAVRELLRAVKADPGARPKPTEISVTNPLNPNGRPTSKIVPGKTPWEFFKTGCERFEKAAEKLTRQQDDSVLVAGLD